MKYEQDFDNLPLEMKKEIKEADKLINQEYLSVVRELLKPFPAFVGRNLILYSNKLWRVLRDENVRLTDDSVLDVLERAVKKSRNFLSSSTNTFGAYRYILKVFNVTLDEMSGKKEDQIDEGESL